MRFFLKNFILEENNLEEKENQHLFFLNIIKSKHPKPYSRVLIKTPTKLAPMILSKKTKKVEASSYDVHEPYQ